MSATVRVELGPRSYDICIGAGVTPGTSLRDGPRVRALVVTDSNVGPLHAERCRSALASRVDVRGLHTVPAGEESKNLHEVERIYSAALDAALDRRSLLVALGGGMVGDLAGFAAATYLRGIDFLQVPTTLLAMVDSSVGGKTGVNLPRGKNLVGSFHQPRGVDIDLATLDTLPDREFRSGLAEVVKYGIISSRVLFERLEREAEALVARDKRILEEVVADCCRIKADVVGQDETEGGVRAILNFGHTLGHAVEAAAGYGALLHGEAVAIGMVYAARVSAQATGLAEADVRRIEQLLARMGLPVGVAARGPSWEDLRQLMTADKKTQGGVPRFVLARELGRVEYGVQVPEPLLRAQFHALASGGE